MLPQQLKEEVFKLSPSDRLALIDALIESLQDTPNSPPNRSSAIRRMRGLLKTDKPALTDEQVANVLEERRVEKYLS